MKELIISPTQSSNFDDEETGCHRRWAFDKVLRLPQVQQKHFEFGTVMHEVIERWLGADDTGRVNGNPVDLYPKNWQGDLEVGEQNLLRFLFDLAVSEGILQRWSHRFLEISFKEHLLDYRNFRISVMGVIDVLRPRQIIDHKTTKNTRYIKSAEKLVRDLQVLTYAMIPLLEAERNGAVAPEEVDVRHNVFIKVPDIEDADLHDLLLGKPIPNYPAKKFVRAVDATVSQEAILENWQRLMRIGQEMADLKVWITEKEPSWQEIPGPKDQGKACNAFGGCAFRSICGKKETITRYTSRVTRINAKSAEAKRPHKVQGATQMSKFKDSLKKLKEQRAKAGSGGQTATEGLTKPAEQRPEVPEETVDADAIAPWANPECTACKGTGFNSKGSPCRICDAKGVKSSWFVFERGDDGVLVWECLPEHEAEWNEARGVTVEAKTEEPAPVTPKLESLKKGKARSSATVSNADAKPAAPAATEEKKGGRPKKAFTLLLNCHPIKKPKVTGVQYIHDVLHNAGQQLVAMAGDDEVDNYYELDPFRRRDLLASVAEKIAEGLGTDFVIADGDSPDVRAMVDALKPYATTVIGS